MTNFRRLGLLVACTTTTLAAVTSLVGQNLIPTQEMIFGHMALGGGWETELTLVAQGADNSSGVVAFVNQDGNLMPVSVNGGTPVTNLSYSLTKGSSRTYRLTLDTGTKVGFIVVGQILPGNENQTSGAISGIVTFRFRSGNAVLSQVGVQPSKPLTKAQLPFDNTNSNRSGIAIAATVSNSVEFSRYREDGTFIESKLLSFSQFNQKAFFVDELFPSSVNTRGLIRMKADSDFFLVALNLNNGNLSTSGILPGIIERDLTLVTADTTNWRLRLTQDGLFLYGIAQRITPSPLVTTASGAIAVSASQRKSLQLNIHSVIVATGQGVNITLIAALNDTNLLNVSGKVQATKEDGTVFATGTFTMFSPFGAQFKSPELQ